MNSLACVKLSINELTGFPIVGKYYETINFFYRGQINWKDLSIYTQGCLLLMSIKNTYVKQLLDKIDSFLKLLDSVLNKVNYSNIKEKDFWKRVDFLIGNYKHVRKLPLIKTADTKELLEKVLNIISGVKSGEMFALTADNMCSIDSFALMLLIFIRLFNHKEIKIKVIYNTDGTIRMQKLNEHGTKLSRLDKIKDYIKQISSLINIDIPEYIEINKEYWVPCIYVERI